MSVINEMTVEQLEEELARANEQLQTFLSYQRTGGNPRLGMPTMGRDTSVLLDSTGKLQRTVQRFEAELRSRGGKPDQLTERFEMKMSFEQKHWLMNSGGAAKLRELIDHARQ